MIHTQVQSYLWRYRHPLFVSTLYIDHDLRALKCSVFYERVITNLSRIKDLCFDDVLLFYYVGLSGFQELFRKFGFFEVTEDMLHVTEESKVKVWCDRDIARDSPTGLGAGNEEAMVRKIIFIIDSNSDLTKMGIQMGSMLNSEPAIGFKLALEKFSTVCKQHHLLIPTSLKCL
jgi:hypothetical protein